MARASSKLEQALRDLIEAYTELEEGLEQKHGEDEASFSHAVDEALEAAIETAIEETDASTNVFGAILSNLTESLERLDPNAFEAQADADYDEIDDVDVDDADVEDADDSDDADDLDDADLDEDEDEDEDYEDEDE